MLFYCSLMDKAGLKPAEFELSFKSLWSEESKVVHVQKTSSCTLVCISSQGQGWRNCFSLLTLKKRGVVKKTYLQLYTERSFYGWFVKQIIWIINNITVMYKHFVVRTKIFTRGNHMMSHNVCMYVCINFIYIYIYKHTYTHSLNGTVGIVAMCLAGKKK